MSWSEVYLTLLGIKQKEAPFRMLANIIHRSLVEKPTDIIDAWPLPLDEDQEEARKRQMAARKVEYEQIKQRLIQRHAAGSA